MRGVCSAGGHLQAANAIKSKRRLTELVAGFHFHYNRNANLLLSLYIYTAVGRVCLLFEAVHTRALPR